ncbi:MAG: hypothetical protein Q8O52_02970 [Sulfuritalea sp.]|nr:hypothetical protein [Sulfuritalea sp.]
MATLIPKQRMVEICYLCGKEIAENDVNSDDHAVPRQMIARTQPKVKGFDYGGVVPTHEECNNEFGPETYCVKALKLIEVLHDSNCIYRFPQTEDSSITFLDGLNRRPVSADSSAASSIRRRRRTDFP